MFSRRFVVGVGLSLVVLGMIPILLIWMGYIGQDTEPQGPGDAVKEGSGGDQSEPIARNGASDPNSPNAKLFTADPDWQPKELSEAHTQLSADARANPL